jgi:hypothetical protein
MTKAAVEGIVASVLTQYGSPWTLHGVSAEKAMWKVDLAGASGPRLTLLVHDGSAHAVRRAVMDALQLDY